MVIHKIILPSGAGLSSGEPGYDAIRTVELTESVNSDNDLALGASFANIMEATIWTPGGHLKLNAGDEIQLLEMASATASDGTPKGFYTLERPVRSSANVLKLTGYDCVSKLDTDLSEWFLFNGSNYKTVEELATAVCQKCGLTLSISARAVNLDCPVYWTIADEAVTGRILMHWICEITGCFFRASTEVKKQIVMDWYPKEGNVSTTIEPGDIFQGTLSYDDYIVAPIEGVQVKYPNKDELWPEKDAGLNTYTISGNILLTGSSNNLTDEEGNPVIEVMPQYQLVYYLGVLEQHLLESTAYVPYKATCRSKMAKPGDRVKIITPNGVEIESIVMTMNYKGRKWSQESTGSPRRDSITVTNNPSGGSVPASQRLNQSEVFNILTGGGTAAGLVIKNGQLYFSPNYILKYLFPSKDGTAYFDLANNILGTKDGTSVAALSGGGFGVYDDGELVLQIKNTADSVAVTGYGKDVNIKAPTLKINDKTVTWKDNGDGTYTMTGQ